MSGEKRHEPFMGVAAAGKKDYHMHPNLLKMPQRGPQFIEAAIERGFEEICFTDHMPFTLTGDEKDRIPFGRVADYCREVRALGERYRDRIRLKVGIEIDYHPSCHEEIEQVLSEGDFDYVIGSSHLHIAGYGVALNRTGRNEFAKMVLENYLAAARSGYFNTISHLDVYRWVFSKYPLPDDGYHWQKHLPELHRLFAAIKEQNMYLEINAAPLFKQFDSLGAYPQPEIVALAREYELQFIYGSDAHRAEHVGFGYGELWEKGGFQ